MQRQLSITAAFVLAVNLVGLTGHANAQLPQLIPTRVSLVRFGGSPAVVRMYKFVSKAPRGGPLFQLPSSSPAATGGSLTVTIGSGTLSCTLAPGLFNGTVGWKELGSPAGSKGYKYSNKNAPTTDPCKVLIVKGKMIKVLALGTGTIAVPVDYPPGNPDISTVLTLGGDDYCGYATAPHFRERADRYIKAKDQFAPGSCPGVPTTTTTAPTTSTTSTPSTTTTTITLACNCCSGGLDLLSFETGIPSGDCGVLRNFRCSNNLSAACVDDGDCDFGTCLMQLQPPRCWDGVRVGPPCDSDADCTGTCGEIAAGNLPLDLKCGGFYSGGGLNAMPLPWMIPDNAKPHFKVTNCDSPTGTLTLGPTTPSEVGEHHCTQGRTCDSPPYDHCVMDSDCPGSCLDHCVFGSPLPIPAFAAAYSYCGVTYVGGDVSGTAQCNGGDADLNIPLRLVLYNNGDLFKASTPPDIPGIQPCPLCDYLCQGGTKDRFPCDDDSECPGGSCGGSTECLGGPNAGDPCTPGTSDSQALGDSENAYPTSHDCTNDPLSDGTAHIGGIPITLNLTTDQVVVNGIDYSNSRRTFFGFCRYPESGCFEGDIYWNFGCPEAVPPATGEAVPCDDDSGCDDGDAYQSCSQRDPGAFSEAASTRISVTGSPHGQCLADGWLHSTTLVSVFAVPPSFNPLLDAYFNLPGPGAITLQGEMQLQ